MKIPARILEAVRGPALAVVVAGCSSTPAAEVVPVTNPAPATPVSVEVPEADPVAYEAAAEAERHRRADALADAADARRELRIADEEAERRRRERAQISRQIGQIRPNPDWLAACGRG